MDPYSFLGSARLFLTKSCIRLRICIASPPVSSQVDSEPSAVMKALMAKELEEAHGRDATLGTGWCGQIKWVLVGKLDDICVGSQLGIHVFVESSEETCGFLC